MDARRTGVEANRIRVGDEVNLVPASGEFKAQFRRDDAAAAVGRITRDTDVHGREKSGGLAAKSAGTSNPLKY
jgi:hypothetical protein